MSTKILRYPLLSLTLAALGASTVSADHDEDEFFYFAGVDTAGLARAQSNDDGTVMFESPEFPAVCGYTWEEKQGMRCPALRSSTEARPTAWWRLFATVLGYK